MDNNINTQETPIQVVGGLIFNSEDQVYLCRNRQWFLVLPGWKVDEEDNDSISSLRREITEELDGLNIPDQNIRPHRNYSNISPDEGVSIQIQTYLFSQAGSIESILSSGKHIESVVNTTSDTPDLMTSWEVHSGKFYSVEEALKYPKNILGDATREILEDMQESRQSILDVAERCKDFLLMADKDLVGDDRQASLDFQERGGVLWFTPETLQREDYRNIISSLIDDLPTTPMFMQDIWGRLGDLFLFGKDSYFHEKSYISDLISLGWYIGKITAIPQISTIPHDEEFQECDIVNHLRFKLRDEALQLQMQEDILERRKTWKEICQETGLSEASVEIGDTIKISWVWEFKLHDEKYIIQCWNDWNVFSSNPETEELIDENITESANAWYIPGAPNSELWQNFSIFIGQIGKGEDWSKLVEKFLNEVMKMKSRSEWKNWSHYASCDLGRNLVIAPDILEGDLLFTELFDNNERYNVRYIV